MEDLKLASTIHGPPIIAPGTAGGNGKGFATLGAMGL
jgi:hypothetical protein